MHIVKSVIKSSRKSLVYLLFLLLVSLPINGNCNILFSPQWTAQSQFAGYYVARDKGFYDQQGVSVKVVYSGLSQQPVDLLLKGIANVVTMDLSQALIAKAAGVDIVNVMQTSHENAFCIVNRYPLKNGIVSLGGTDLAACNQIDEDLLSLLKKKIGRNVNRVKYEGGINIFLSGAVNHCFVCSYNELLQIRECGFQLKKGCLLRLRDYGLNIPQDGVYVTKSFYKTHKKEVDGFVAASIKGWLWARQHVEQTVGIVMRETTRERVGTNRYHQRQMLKEVLALQKYNPKNPNAFKLSKQEFDKVIKLYTTINKPYASKIKYADLVR